MPGQHTARDFVVFELVSVADDDQDQVFVIVARARAALGKFL
jgi:hypothetical protein